MTIPASPKTFPKRADFAASAARHLDAAYVHPTSLASKAAADRHAATRLEVSPTGGLDQSAMRDRVRALFAQLIGASADEIAFVPSTMAGENMVLAALGIGAGKGRVVTDALHFNGSLYLYERLAQQGVDVQVLPARDGVIDLADLATALQTPTDLVAVSAISHFNGFRHDLDAVCQLAHGRGALVYADIIQAAGATPFDVTSSGVDFCACATYKWLMGDFGLGFLFARKDRLDRLDARQFGYQQLSQIRSQPQASPPVVWRAKSGAAGHFGLGTIANGVAAQLDVSLRYLLDLDVAAIADYRQGLTDRLAEGVRSRGGRVLTPAGRQTPILVFTLADIAGAGARLDVAGLFASVYEDRIRVAPSIYNGPDDIDRLLAALGGR